MPKIEVVKVATLTGHRDCIYTLEEGLEDNIFYSGSGDGMVVRWDLKNPETGELIVKVTNSVYALNFLNKENQLLLGENFEGIRKVDLKEKKEIQSSKITDASIFDIKSYEGKIFVATGDGYLIVLSQRDFSTLAKIKVAEKSARSIAINKKGNELAVGFSDHVIRIFSLDEFKLRKNIFAHGNSIFSVTFSPDGKYLLSGSRDAHLKIWDCENDYTLKESVVAHMYAINHIEYSPNGKYFATCSMDKSIKIWDGDEFKLLKVIDRARHAGHGTSVNKLLWSSYHDQLISCSDDRNISIWKINF